MPDRLDPKLLTFLKELAELSKKHGLYIGGCGDCGSPWIYDNRGRTVLEHLGYAGVDGVYGSVRDMKYRHRKGGYAIVDREKYGL